MNRRYSAASFRMCSVTVDYVVRQRPSLRVVLGREDLAFGEVATRNELRASRWAGFLVLSSAPGTSGRHFSEGRTPSNGHCS